MLGMDRKHKFTPIIFLTPPHLPRKTHRDNHGHKANMGYPICKHSFTHGVLSFTCNLTCPMFSITCISAPEFARVRKAMPLYQG